jgi:hypothetical protein
MKQLSLFALSLLVLASACNKKEDSTPDSQYIVNDVRDFSLSTDTTQLRLGVAAVNPGFGDSVVLQLSGLPEGLSVTGANAAAIPPFNASFGFVNSYAPAGNYPLSILAISKKESKSYKLNLIIPPFNGIRINGKLYENAMTGNPSTGPLQTFNIGCTEVSGYNGKYIIQLGAAMPEDGRQTFRLVQQGSNADRSLAADEAKLTLEYYWLEKNNIYTLSGQDKNATITINRKGTWTVNCPRVVLENSIGEQKLLSISVSRTL